MMHNTAPTKTLNCAQHSAASSRTDGARDARHRYQVDTAAFDKGFVARRLAEIAARYDVRGLAYDRWRIEELRPRLADEGCELPMEPWGQGFRDMAPAVDALEIAVLNRRLRHGGHPVLRWNAANAALAMDPAGQRKLDKARGSGRIDGLVALAMAIGLAERAAAPARSIYDSDERAEGFLFV